MDDNKKEKNVYFWKNKNKRKTGVFQHLVGDKYKHEPAHTLLTPLQPIPSQDGLF